MIPETEPGCDLRKELLTEDKIDHSFEFIGIFNLAFEPPQSVERHRNCTEQASSDKFLARRRPFGRPFKPWNFRETYSRRSQKSVAPTFALGRQDGKHVSCNIDPLVQFGRR